MVTRANEKHPIQNLLDDVDMLEVEIRGGTETPRIIPAGDDLKAHLKDMLLSAYATGKVSN